MWVCPPAPILQSIQSTLRAGLDWSWPCGDGAVPPFLRDIMPSALSAQEAPEAAGETTFAPTINDLAIRVGTVNGSGSQSANLVLLRALYAMGVPCSGKNVFPSNIEGLPTWFHIRGSGKGYVGHVLDPQILVCMNEATAKDDVLRLKPGAICFARDDFDADLADLCDDVTLFLVPFQKLAEKAYPPDKADKSYRDKLRKVINMVYVGVLASACKIEFPAVETAIRREFPGRKAKAAEINIAAARAGFEWAQENLPADLPFQVRRVDNAPEKILIEGNKAAALGATFGGVSVLTWYPITPSSSLAEYAEDFLKKHRVNPDGERTFAIVQAEDELAAIGMAIGAGWGGSGADGDFRPRDLANVRIRWIGLLCRNPGGDRQRAAHGPQHRIAHPYQPGRYPQASLPGPWRFPPYRLDSRVCRGVLLLDR